MTTVHFELSESKAAALQAKALKCGVSPEQYLRQILDRDLDGGPATIRATTAPQRPISEVISEIWSDLADDARAQLPVDGAAQIDHYVYGLPKRDR